MKGIFWHERARILSNYARLFAGLVIGLLVTRMLLSAGEQIFAIYVTITVGIGISIMLTELLRMSLVPVLGASVFQGKVQDVAEFQSNLTAAFFVSILATTLGASIMFGLGYLMLRGGGSFEQSDAAWSFLCLRVVMMVVTVVLTPAMSTLMVTGRQPLHNMFLFLERLSELLGVALPLFLLSGSDHSDASLLVEIGIFVSILTSLTYVTSAWVAFNFGSKIRPAKQLPKVENIKRIFRRIGWSSLQTVSMNLYVRADVLIVLALLGPSAIVALGIAVRLMGFVRQATMGLVSGLDATFASLKGQRKTSDFDSKKAEKDEIKLLSVSTALQGGVVFQLGVLFLMLREEIVVLWIGDVLEGPRVIEAVEEIVSLAGLMVLGMGVRSLNLGWMTALTGRGNAKSFTPWLLPGAIGNATVLVVWGLVAPETFSVMVVGWVFVFFQLSTHAFIIPIVTARSFGCELLVLIKPLFKPLIISCLTYLLADGLSGRYWTTSDHARVLVVIFIVSLGSAISLVLSLNNSSQK